MILENVVLQNANTKERTRVIFQDDDNNRAYIISLEKDTSMPIKVDITALQSEIENNLLIKIVDPYLKNIDEEVLTEKQKEKRDSDWNLINHIWNNDKNKLLDKKVRNDFLEKQSSHLGITPIKLKRILTRFWQRGMNKNALLPDYVNSGGRGKSKKLKADSKIGRPRKINYIGEKEEGINVTEDIKKMFEVSVNKFYRKKEKISLTETYNLMLREFFSDRYFKEGQEEYKVWDKSRIPTYYQFYYWFRNSTDVKKDISFREGSKAFELKHRPLLNNSTIETNGPGTRFQIDATIADIYLVSSINRNRIIGRPVVYAIIDVYSRLITGIYVGLEGPSWTGAMMALDNMIENKVEFCKRYGIEITEEQWPSKHLPEIIIADRGEFEGYSVENLINNLNVKIENTSPYRGDLKGDC